MEQLFNDLQQQIAGKMGDVITLIDEDCGQLEALTNGEDQYPVTFPCVLISIPQPLGTISRMVSSTERLFSQSGLLSTVMMILTMEVRRSSMSPNVSRWQSV